MRVALAILGFLLLRVLLAPAFDLMPQDTYYFFYAEHLSLSYLDHPPMIGYLLFLAAVLLGKSALTVRLVSVLSIIAAQVAFYALARAFLPRHRALIALLLFTSTTMVTILSLMATPDVPLMLFWILALLSLQRAVLQGERAHWLLAGVLMGLAFDSKYTAVFLQGGLLLFLLASGDHRRYLRTVWPYACVGMAQLTSLPVYLWNARHGFASFAFQSVERASLVREINPRYPLGLVITQAMLVLQPVLFGLVVVLAWKYLRRLWRRRLRLQPAVLFLLSFFLPILAFCITVSPLVWIKPNWMQPAYVTAIILVARLPTGWIGRWHLGPSVLWHGVMAVQLVFYPVPMKGETTWFGWEALAAQAEARAAVFPEAFLFAADSYKTTAELMFYADRKVYGMSILGYKGLHYDYVGDDLDALRGRDALLFANEGRLEPSGRTRRNVERARQFFDAVEELEPMHLDNRWGQPARLMRVFLCRGYRGVCGPRHPEHGRSPCPPLASGSR